MSRLTGSQVKQIQDALLSAYSSQEALAMMVRFELERNLSEIAGGDTLTVVVFSLITWAEAHGVVDDLIAGACRNNPDNPELQALADAAKAWSAGETAADAQAPAEQATAASVSAASTSGEDEFEYDVFISYSHADGDWVRDSLLPRLEGSGLRVCVDYRDFEIGVSSIVNMEQAVEQSRRTLLIMTPNWVNSEWTAFESIMTQTSDPIGLRRRTIPLMREQCSPPSRIAMLTYADFTAKNDAALPWERLLRSLRK